MFSAHLRARLALSAGAVIAVLGLAGLSGGAVRPYTTPADPSILDADLETDDGNGSDDADAATGAPHAIRTLRVTAYRDRGLTAAGVPSGLGQCAAPADIPFGAQIHIPALGRTFVVTDRTHKRFRHNTVDLFMLSTGECRTFGRKYLECEITLPEKPHRYGCQELALAAQRLREP